MIRGFKFNFLPDDSIKNDKLFKRKKRQILLKAQKLTKQINEIVEKYKERS